MNRQERIQNILEVIGAVTREFNVRGSYPFKEHSLGRPHIDVLYLLTHHEELSIKDVSERLNVTSGAATQFVDYLQARNLVQKTEKPTDKRVRLVSLTPHAKQEIEEFKQGYQALVAGHFQSLSDDELATLSGILHKIEVK